MIHTTNSINKIGSLGSLFFVKLASDGGLVSLHLVIICKRNGGLYQK